MKDLIIIGASGHGKVLENIAKLMNKWKNIFFLDDDVSKKDKQIIGTILDYPGYIDSCDFIVGIGDNHIRQKIYNLLEKKSVTFATFIHPFTSIGTNVKIGTGSVIMPGVVINCNSSVEKGCIVNTSSCVDHDCIIGEFVHISPASSLGGSVIIQSRTWIGLGAKIINNVKITHDCVVGAGSTVIGDIIESGTYVGSPARRVKKI